MKMKLMSRKLRNLWLKVDKEEDLNQLRNLNKMLKNLKGKGKWAAKLKDREKAREREK